MTTVVYALVKLRPGVDRDEYERFEREVDYVVASKLESIVNYRTHRITEMPPIGGGPWDYIERIEITDRPTYERDLANGGKELIDQLFAKYLDQSRTYLLWTERLDP